MDKDNLSFKYDDPYAEVDLNATDIQELYQMKSYGNELTSTHPAQDSLRFTTKKQLTI